MLVEQGSRLTAAMVRRAEALQVPVVAAFNCFRSPDDDEEALDLAKADIVRLHDFGVAQ